MKKFLLIFLIFVLIFTGSNNIVFSESQYQWRLEDFDIPEDAYDNMLLIIDSVELTPTYICTFENTNVHAREWETDYINFSFSVIDQNVNNQVRVYRINPNDLSVSFFSKKNLRFSDSSYIRQMLADCNFPLMSKDDGSFFYHPGMYVDYYIEDKAMIFDNVSIDALLEMEKKWEKNLNCQFFIKTFVNDLENEVMNMQNYGNSKTSGNGSLTLYIQYRPDGTFRLGLGLSRFFAYELPYGFNNHDYALYLLDNSIWDAYDLKDSNRIVHFLNLLYQDILYKDDVPLPSMHDEYCFTPDTNLVSVIEYRRRNFWKSITSNRNLLDINVAGYTLKSSKLEYQNPPSIRMNLVDAITNLFLDVPVEWVRDSYYFSIGKDVENYHIWFYDVEGVWFFDDNPNVTPTTFTPTPTNTPEPTPPVGTAVPYTPDVPPAEPTPTGDITDNLNVLMLLINLIKAILMLIVSLVSFLFKALTYVVQIKDVSATNHILTPEMVNGLTYLKNFEIPFFDMKIWSIIELMFAGSAIFIAYKVVRKIINTANQAG